MAIDLKFVDTVNNTLTAGIWPYPDKVDGEYSLVQKVVKSLLTEPGYDQFDPGFGAGLKSAMLGIPGQDLQAARQAAAIAAQKVLQDLAGTPELLDLRVEGVTFNVDTLAWEVEMVVATQANEVTISVPGA
jgi:hypothetical protein